MTARSDSQRLQLHAKEIVVAARQQLSASRNHLSGYMGHVALECYLKSWILSAFGGNQAKFNDSHPALHKKYFGSSEGHDLSRLVGDMVIRRKVAATGETNPCSGSVWSRMTHGDRPYSLRYREEPAITKSKVAEELALTEAVMDRLGRLP